MGIKVSLNDGEEGALEFLKTFFPDIQRMSKGSDFSTPEGFIEVKRGIFTASQVDDFQRCGKHYLCIIENAGGAKETAAGVLKSRRFAFLFELIQAGEISQSEGKNSRRITGSIDDEMYQWIQDQIKTGRYGNMSHALRDAFAIRKAMIDEENGGDQKKTELPKV